MDCSPADGFQMSDDVAQFRPQRIILKKWPIKKMKMYVEATNSAVEIENLKKDREEAEHFSDDENFPPGIHAEATKEADTSPGESVPTDAGTSEPEDGLEMFGETRRSWKTRERRSTSKRSSSTQSTPSPIRTRQASNTEWSRLRRKRTSSTTSQTTSAKVFRATGRLLRGAAEIKKHYPEQEVSTEQLGQLDKMCTKVMNDGVVKGDDYVFNEEGEYDVEYHPRRLMSCAKSGKLLVLWDQWNFTHCTEEPPKNLRRAKILVEQYLEYEKGIEAIKKNLEATEWYKQLKKKPIFTRIRLPYTQLELSDEKLKQEMKKEQFLRKIGYWAVKALEIEWLEVLDPLSKFSVPPLYLESMSPRQPMWKYLPMIEFLKNYEYSEQAENLLMAKVRHPHMCVFKDVEQRCRDCRLLCELTLTSTSTVDMTNVDSDTHFFHIVCCHESKCDCVGGWKDCQSWLPTYPRQSPLVIFFDPRYSGWGVRAVRDIPRGTIVSEYVGEVISKREAEDRVTSYQMGLKTVVIDANLKGNESRFFGHSCDPNMAFCPVYVRGFDMSKQYRNVLITIRDIKAGEDMNCDYHPGPRKRPTHSWSKCRCGSANCRGWL